jgi:hypothetical protein
VQKTLLQIVVLTFLASSCAVIDARQPAGSRPAGIEIFPSPYAADSDFLNLVSEDRTLQEQARRNVLVFYNCLIKTNPNYGRQDPMVLSRSQFIAFSEIPGRIYQGRLDRLATLTKDYNKAAIQAMVDIEIAELKRIRWSEIQKEINAIVTGARKVELEKSSCPVSEMEMQQRIQRFEAQKRSMDQVSRESFLRPLFLPPLM